MGQNQRGDASLGDGGIQLGHVGGVQRLGAEGGLMQLPEYLDGGLELPQLVGVLLGGQAEDKAVFEQLQLKAADVARVGGHVAVEVVQKAVQRVDIDPGVDPEAEQIGLVDQPGLAEQLHGVVGGDRPLLDGKGLGGQLPHPLLHPVQEGLIQGKAAPGQTEQSAAEGVLHRDALHVFPARHIVEGLQHEKYRAALIGLDARLVLGGDHFQGAVPVQGFVQLTELAVPVDQQDVIGAAVLKISSHGAVGRPVGVGALLPSHGDFYQLLFLHKIWPPIL